jgi:Domain of unknown function (DUF4123)
MNTFSLDCPQVQAISDALHQACAASGQEIIWLALDGANSPLPELEEGLMPWDARVRQPVTLRHPEIDVAWHPQWYALRLDKADDCHLLKYSIVWALEEAQPKCVRQGLGRKVSGWLAIDEPVHAAANHWASLMVCKVPNRVGSTLLRLHDPAVLWAIWRILTPAQQRHWQGPVQTWWLLNPAGQLAPLIAQQVSHTSPTLEPAVHLSGGQWQSIEHVSAFNLGLQAWMNQDHAQAVTTEMAELAFVNGMRALQRANDLGISDLHSRALFCELALSQHPMFDQHPRIKALLSDFNAAHPLGGLMADLTAADWQTIAADMDTKDNQSGI